MTTPQKIQIATLSELADRQPTGAKVDDTDLVIVRIDDVVSVLYGRCTHRGALLADGFVDGPNLVCSAHGWDYCCRSGVSPVDPSDRLQTFQVWLDEDVDAVFVDANEVRLWAKHNPPAFHHSEIEI